MEWTKPLTVLLVVLVVGMIAGSILELFRTTLADPQFFVASAVSTAVLAAVVVVAVATGARSREWISNPDSYW